MAYGEPLYEGKPIAAICRRDAIFGGQPLKGVVLFGKNPSGGRKWVEFEFWGDLGAGTYSELELHRNQILCNE